MDGAPDRQAAAARYLEAAIAEHGPEAIIEALEAAVPPGAGVGEMIVHASDELTMLFARVPPRFQSGIHDHTVFACIGQLVGEETNTFFEQTDDGLREVETATARPGQVIQLPADVVHGIANPGDEVACALHLYGGNFREIADERSLWDAESHDRMAFSFPALVQQSIKTMHAAGNRPGLEAVAEAIPAVRPVVEAL
jgi:predicted metal-dependent enzyme (double-stranded beta helix superfamily)